MKREIVIVVKKCKKVESIMIDNGSYASTQSKCFYWDWVEAEDLNQDLTVPSLCFQIFLFKRFHLFLWLSMASLWRWPSTCVFSSYSSPNLQIHKSNHQEGHLFECFKDTSFNVVKNKHSNVPSKMFSPEFPSWLSSYKPN